MHALFIAILCYFVLFCLAEYLIIKQHGSAKPLKIQRRGNEFMRSQPNQQLGIAKPLVIVVIVAIAALLWFLNIDGGQTLKKQAQLKTAEVVGNIAARQLPTDVAGGFHEIPIELKQLADNVFQATGVANTHMIVTETNSVLFDTGLSIQAAQQIKQLSPVQSGGISHIILSHSHADHIGGTKFWQEKDTQIIAHREYREEQRYLTELEPYLWNRNRTVFPWLPEKPTTQELFRYGGIEPNILVDHNDYSFTEGGISFEVLSTPGAEGADNLSLWLPEQKILFSGDFFGPLWPQFPNIFTMRGEKIRKPIEYIASLNKLIALEPKMIVPSHHLPVEGEENIRAGMIKMRDAVQYVHDEVIAGMNAGKTVYQLMDEIALPAELDLTQEHGKVSWAVKSIWEYYATWFHFDTTTELYSVPRQALDAELGALVGVDKLLAKAQSHFDQQQAIHALHYLELALAVENNNRQALTLRRTVLEYLLEQAVNSTGNNYEKDYLRARINVTQATLDNTE